MYSEFADIYDRLMADVDYDAWANFYENIFNNYGIKPELVLDLGCGTGTLTKIMAERGYDMTGIDSSCKMLSKAIEKGGNILYLNQDMTEFELYGTMGAIYSSLDCVNYVTDEDAVQEIFNLAENYLDFGGLFIFDINTKYKLSEVLGKNSYIYDNDDVFYTWESYYDEETKLCDFELSFFVKEDDGSYYRIDEFQTEKAWDSEKLEKMLKKAGFVDVKIYGDKTFDAPKETEERIFFVARKREN